MTGFSTPTPNYSTFELTNGLFQIFLIMLLLNVDVYSIFIECYSSSRIKCILCPVISIPRSTQIWKRFLPMIFWWKVYKSYGNWVWPKYCLWHSISYTLIASLHLFQLSFHIQNVIVILNIRYFAILIANFTRIFIVISSAAVMNFENLIPFMSFLEYFISCSC